MYFQIDTDIMSLSDDDFVDDLYESSRRMKMVPLGSEEKFFSTIFVIIYNIKILFMIALKRALTSLAILFFYGS